MKGLPPVETFMTELTKQLHRMAVVAYWRRKTPWWRDPPRRPSSELLVEKINRVIAVKDDLPENEKRQLIEALQGAAVRFQRLADRLGE